MKNFSLPALAIKRPVTTIMLVVTLLSLGMISWWLTPIEFIMRIDVPFLNVYIPYPGAAPQQVEKEVGIPAEGKFRTITGLRRISTRSSTGGCWIFLRFDWDTDMRLVTAELRDRIERLKLVLPEEIDQVFIRRFSTDTEPVMHFALFREEEQDDLARSARTILKSKLLRIDGVADVQVSGRELQEIYVEFDQNALRSLNLGISEVIATLQSSSLNMGVGQIFDGDTKFFVRVEGELTKQEMLENILLTPNGVRLKDVANVTQRPPSGADSFTVDGKRGVFISVIKESEANTVATCDAIREELDLMVETPTFSGTEIFMFHDQSDIIRYALGNLFKAGQYGSILALVVLMVFLRRLRPTVIVALTTPASMVVALIFIYFSGYSLNMVSISALLVSIGMLVDNAIVVMENIQRRRSLGELPVDAAINGANEVGMAITASTLTTMVVFIPVMYMDAGELSTFMKEFAGPVTTSLVASLVLALTVLPLAESRSKVKKQKSEIKKAIQIPNFKILHRTLGVYGAVLGFATRRRPVTLTILALILVLTYYFPFSNVGMSRFPDLDMRTITLQLVADPNYGYDEVKETAAMLESRINSIRDEVGVKNIYVNTYGSGAQFRIYLVREEDLEPGKVLPCSTKIARERINEILPPRIPGAQIDTGISSMGPSESSSVSVRLRGNDTKTLEEFAEEFRRMMATLDNLKEVKTSKDQAGEELQIRVDEAKASAAGITPLGVARSVDFALRGTMLPPMKQEGQEISVRAQLQGEDRKSKEDLENVAIRGATSLVSLYQLVNMQRAPANRSLSREDGKSVTNVVGKTDSVNLTAVEAELERLKATVLLPYGYFISMGDEFEGIRENQLNFQSTIFMSLILIYLVMAALFESPLLPLSILSTVLLAFVGVYWSMYLTETSMDTVALVGSVLMCGIIVNNGIVIVDHINQLRLEGMERYEAVVQAGINRFRPVMMTSLTTILGCIPIAIGASDESSALTALGRALVGGLTVGTLLTLVIVPVFYTIIDDCQNWLRNYFGNLIQIGAKASKASS